MCSLYIDNFKKRSDVLHFNEFCTVQKYIYCIHKVLINICAKRIRDAFLDILLAMAITES